ncbi:MAG: L-rhamnose/proton symporter RhaT [Lentisphaeria bacterium]|nr:L-rhamnose/proton symporter RhaT [Lentisphaeria bacterium]
MFTGLTILVVSAILGAIVPLPLRISRRFHTEHVLVAGYGVATLAVPLLFAMLFIESWTQALQQVGVGHLLTVAAMGLGWGIGALCFGHGIAAVGISLGLAIVMGINTVAGALVPMARQWLAIPLSAKVWIFVGITVCLAGVSLCSRAGCLREKDKEAGQPTAMRSARGFVIGIVLCVVSGVMSACAGIGFDYGQPIMVAAAELGADERLATFVVWLPIWWGGGVAMVLWSLFEIARQKTFDRFTGVGAGRDLLLCIILIGLCMPAVHVSFGIGAYYLGDTMGRAVGWAISIALSLVAGIAVGFIAGEWRGATARSKGFLYAGIAVLIGATVCLAFASSLGTG